MVRDFYSILGIARDASESDIKQAYRRLASQYHPDKGGDTAKFQEIQEAYAALIDPERRREYDNPRQKFNHSSSAFDMDRIFDMFGTRFNAQSSRTSSARIMLWISLRDVALGGPRSISVSSPSGQQNLEIQIPLGIEDGNSVRYPGIAPGGMDLVITFRIQPEAGWQRQDQHVVRDVTVSIWDLVLGKDVEIETLTGRVISVTIPPHTQPGTMLRVRGHGLSQRGNPATGDLFVKLAAKIPDQVSIGLLDHIRVERDQ